MGFGCIRTPRMTRTVRAAIDVGSLASAEYVRLFEWLPWSNIEITRSAADKIGLL
jgi:hypothetical protein